jgi:hypothetical protein
MQFLSKVNSGGKKLLDEDKLESMIDRFEKERSKNA